MELLKRKETYKNFDIIPLSWDTEFFGIDSSRLNIKADLSEKERERVLSFCKNFEFNTIANIGNKKNINIWLGEKTNAFLVDINMQFSKEITTTRYNYNKNIFIENSLSYNEDIVDISKTAFKYSRFFNDPYLSAEKKYEIYNQWVKSAFNNDEKNFVYLKKDEKIIGFLIFSTDASKKEAIIELLAVNSEYKGKKIGTQLINELEIYLNNNNYLFINVGTQADNLEAINLYINYGFKYKSNTSIYHLWVNNKLEHGRF